LEVEDLNQNNKSPQGLVPLEQHIDRHDGHKQETKWDQHEDYVKINISNNDSPRLLKVEKGASIVGLLYSL
jgi:hypothetical protein